jgi:hypothetical protein
MTLKEARIRLKQSSTPERIVSTLRHDHLCLASGNEQKFIPPATCTCVGGRKKTYSVVLQ